LRDSQDMSDCPGDVGSNVTSLAAGICLVVTPGLGKRFELGTARLGEERAKDASCDPLLGLSIENGRKDQCYERGGRDDFISLT